MPLPFHLGLRNNNHMVTVVRTAEGARPQLGVAYPQDEHRRSHIPNNWGLDGQSPRQSEATTINLPLSPRAQTILSYQLDPAIQNEVNGGLSPMVHSRYDTLPGIKQRIHIGHGHVDMAVRSHITINASPRKTSRQTDQFSNLTSIDSRRGK